MKKISVIVPVYNVETYIEKCVKSILNQTYKELEIILVDDASTDNSGKICDELAKEYNQIVVIHNEKNMGPSTTKNVGLHYATGQLIGFVDSDDTIDSDMFELLVTNMNKYNADISACRGRDILLDGNIRYEITDNNILVYNKEEAISAFLLNKQVSGGLCDKIFTKELINKNSFKEDIRNNEDKLFCYFALKECKVYVQQNISKYNYLIRSTSVSNTAKFTQYMKMIDVNKTISEDVNTYGTDKEKGQAMLNLQLSILAACRKAALEGETLKRKKEYIALVKELRKSKINYSLLSSRNRKIEFKLLTRFPYLYSFVVKLYNFRKEKI